MTLRSQSMNKRKEFVIIGQNIRQLRQQAGYAQEEFAHVVGIARGHYGRIERGEHGPTAAALIKIALVLNIEVGLLFPKLVELKKLNN